MAELAAQCAKLGHPEITRSVIENIEGGRRDGDGHRRRDITVDEVIAIANGLSVSPSLLVPQMAPPVRGTHHTREATLTVTPNATAVPTRTAVLAAVETVKDFVMQQLDGGGAKG